MKKILTYTLLLPVIISCEDNSDREANLPASYGNLNNLLVVMENDWWNSSPGEAVRERFAYNVMGLPQDEPVFSISQIPPEAFSDFVLKSRIFLYVQQSDSVFFRVLDNPYAKPQKGIFVSAPTREKSVELISENAENAVAAIFQCEMDEKQRRTELSLLNIKPIEDEMGVTFRAPSAYRIAKVADDFAWIRKDIRTGTTNLMVYTMPYREFKDDKQCVNYIIRMRDSIGKAHIEGPRPGTWMITEQAYAPYFHISEIDGKPAYVTKGTWEVANDFMAGPFANYIIQDPDNDRLLVVEGFTYAPSVSKRDYQFELESIIYSINILP